MMDLSISGTPEKDSVVFTLDGESGTVDPFSGKIHFSLEEKKTYRLFFRQKSEQNLPRFAEILLNILFLPVRGVFNVLTFNANSSWEKDICGYKISGYMDITLKENTELSFSLKPGRFDKTTGTFSEPAISFSPKIPFEQTCLPDAGEINKAHRNHVLNICSAGLLCLALLLYLFFVGWEHAIPLACMVTSGLILCFGALIFCLILHSFRKRDRLQSALTEQSKKHG